MHVSRTHHLTRRSGFRAFTCLDVMAELANDKHLYQQAEHDEIFLVLWDSTTFGIQRM